jgi:chorismate mutase
VSRKTASAGETVSAANNVSRAGADRAATNDSSTDTVSTDTTSSDTASAVVSSADSAPRLAHLRRRIDRLDAAMVYLLAERFACTEEIGRIKSEAHLPALDQSREAQQKERLAGIADEAGISQELVVEVFETVTDLVKRRHRELGAPETQAPVDATGAS